MPLKKVTVYSHLKPKESWRAKQPSHLRSLLRVVSNFGQQTIKQLSLVGKQYRLQFLQTGSADPDEPKSKKQKKDQS
jgi:hypothetical protein